MLLHAIQTQIKSALNFRMSVVLLFIFSSLSSRINSFGSFKTSSILNLLNSSNFFLFYCHNNEAFTIERWRRSHFNLRINLCARNWFRFELILIEIWMGLMAWERQRSRIRMWLCNGRVAALTIKLKYWNVIRYLWNQLIDLEVIIFLLPDNKRDFRHFGI